MYRNPVRTRRRRNRAGAAAPSLADVFEPGRSRSTGLEQPLGVFRNVVCGRADMIVDELRLLG
jgi:hypothetical protein